MDRELPKRVYSNNKRKLSLEDPFIAKILGQNGAQHQLPDANRRHLTGNLHQPSFTSAAAKVLQRVSNEVSVKSQKRNPNSSTDSGAFPNKQISHLRRQQQQLLPDQKSHLENPNQQHQVVLSSSTVGKQGILGIPPNYNYVNRRPLEQPAALVLNPNHSHDDSDLMENYTRCTNYVNSIIPHQRANVLMTESIETDQEDNITVEEVDRFTAMCYETIDEAAANACAERPEMENEVNVALNEDLQEIRIYTRRLFFPSEDSSEMESASVHNNSQDWSHCAEPFTPKTPFIMNSCYEPPSSTFLRSAETLQQSRLNALPPRVGRNRFKNTPFNKAPPPPTPASSTVTLSRTSFHPSTASSTGTIHEMIFQYKNSRR